MITPGLYAVWRAQHWAAHLLAERPDGYPLSEHLLQLIWQHQRLRPAALATADGQPIRVLHPGFWSHEPGPDFRGAVVQFGESLAQHGDVEVDLASRGWRDHGHDQNPNFKNVILHVVWSNQLLNPAPLPTLILESRLDSSLEELGSWLRQEPRTPPANVFGRCLTPLSRLPQTAVHELLRQAGEARLRAKADQLQALAKQAGWEQALWQGLFGALGYKNNIWPMRQLAGLVPMILADVPKPATPLALQTRLLGLSGLLPAATSGHGRSTSGYLAEVWSQWWREREQFTEMALPRSMWRLGSLRPANHPQRRLGLAAHWLAMGDLPQRLERWFAAARPGRKLASSLLEILQPAEDDFWSHHWTLESNRMARPQPLIGPPRVTDLATNVILPWLWIRSVIGNNAELQQLAEACYFGWPKGEDNAVLRLAGCRLFGSAKAWRCGAAAEQQGILQIVRDFCDYSDALCDRCPFPQLVNGRIAPQNQECADCSFQEERCSALIFANRMSEE